MKNYLDFAHLLADISGRIVAEHFQEHRATSYKADRTPVTEADQAAEAAMRSEILGQFPDHGILGEEGGAERLDAEFVWVLDPIDGTASYMAGIPTFGTLIGLLHHGIPIIGVMNQPVIGQRWSAQKGHGPYLNGAVIATRECRSLDEALLATTSPDLFDVDGRKRFDAIRHQARFTIYGTDCYGYGMLAAGKIDAVIESGLRPYDILPLVPIIEAAGGVISNWDGTPLRRAEKYDVCVSGSRDLHAELIERLNG